LETLLVYLTSSHSIGCERLSIIAIYGKAERGFTNLKKRERNYLSYFKSQVCSHLLKYLHFKYFLKSNKWRALSQPDKKIKCILGLYLSNFGYLVDI
jgi:hypothetical protein